MGQYNWDWRRKKGQKNKGKEDRKEDGETYLKIPRNITGTLSKIYLFP